MYLGVGVKNLGKNIWIKMRKYGSKLRTSESRPTFPGSYKKRVYSVLANITAHHGMKIYFCQYICVSPSVMIVLSEPSFQLHPEFLSEISFFPDQ